MLQSEKPVVQNVQSWEDFAKEGMVRYSRAKSGPPQVLPVNFMCFTSYYDKDVSIERCEAARNALRIDCGDS